MKKVTSSQSLVLINHYRNLLQSEGIPSFIRNEYLGAIVGEMPFEEVWPELWVKNDLHYDRARQLIDSRNLAAESPASPWRCPGCGTENEGQFAACWTCGTAEAYGR